MKPSHGVCITIAVPHSSSHPTTDWLLWQLADSAFPSGGFAHSGGLEAVTQHRLIWSGEDFGRYLEAQLASAAYASAPFALAAHREPVAFDAVDSTCDAFLSNHVTNRASRAQGGSFLAAADRIFGGEPLKNLRARVRGGHRPGHFAPVLGATMAFLGVDAERTCRLLMFFTLRSSVSSAVRLGLVGPLEGQTIQFGLAERVEYWAARAEHVAVDDAAQCAPVLDLIQASHDRLYSRLFQS